jgi:ABC-2 type transport system ATP-binding protein
MSKSAAYQLFWWLLVSRHNPISGGAGQGGSAAPVRVVTAENRHGTGVPRCGPGPRRGFAGPLRSGAVAVTISRGEVRQVCKRSTLRNTRSLKETVVWKSPGRHLINILLTRDDVALSIQQRKTPGLLGCKGSGKPLLLKLISGVKGVDEDSIGVRGPVAGLIGVAAGFHCQLTGRENICLNGATLGRSWPQIDRLCADIVDFSAISRFLGTEVKRYSSGMFLRLAFAVAVRIEPDVLLVDEIPAVEDEPFARKVAVRMQELVEGRQHCDPGQPGPAHGRAPVWPGHRVVRGTLCVRHRPQRRCQTASTDRTGMIS